MKGANPSDLAWLKSDISRNNNFDLIRLFAAVQVVLWHGAGHMRLPSSQRFISFLDLIPGVPIFFFLSGMLVTYSLSSSGSLTSFYMKRVRRVFPALWVSFFVSLGILIAFHQVTPYELRLPAFWFWVTTQLSFFQFYNPAFFRDFATGVVNGSLWTISVEIGFYLILPLLPLLVNRVKVSGSRRRVLLQVVVVAGFILSYSLFSLMAKLGNMSGSGPKAALWVRLLNQTFVPHFWLFGLGILAYIHYTPLKTWLVKWSIALFAAYFLIGFLFQYLGWMELPFPLLLTRVWLCAVIFGLGASPIPLAATLLHGWDLSYGLYVFHMLVMNSAIALGYTGSWLNWACVLVISLILSALSWNFVERPSIRMKTSSIGQLPWRSRTKRETVAW